MEHKVNFKQSLTGANSEFSFSLTSCYIKVKKHSLPYYLPIARGRIVGFILFRMKLELCGMQTALSRISLMSKVFACGLGDQGSIPG